MIGQHTHKFAIMGLHTLLVIAGAIVPLFMPNNPIGIDADIVLGLILPIFLLYHGGTLLLLGPASWLPHVISRMSKRNGLEIEDKHPWLRQASILLLIGPLMIAMALLTCDLDDLARYWRGIDTAPFSYLWLLLFGLVMALRGLKLYPPDQRHGEREMMVLATLIWTPIGVMAMAITILLRSLCPARLRGSHVPGLMGLAAGQIYNFAQYADLIMLVHMGLLALIMVKMAQTARSIASVGAEITKPEDVHPYWLMQVLKLRGYGKHMLEGQITHKGRWQDGGWQGRLFIPAAPDAAYPRSLYLKIFNGDQYGMGQQQILFHTRLYRHAGELPIPLCYDYSLHPQAGHILLQDLTDSHEPMADLPLDGLIIDGLAASLARLHKVHWASQGTAAQSYAAHRAAQISNGLAALLDKLGDTLPADDTALILRILAHHPRLIDQRLQATPLGTTRLHGGLTPRHVMVPRFGDPEQMGETHYLLAPCIPFSEPPHGLAVSDLAGLLHHVSPAERRQHEARLLESWQAALASSGLTYALDTARHDYRLALPMALYDCLAPCLAPGWQPVAGTAQPIPGLAAMLAALRDWGWQDMAEDGTLPALAFTGNGLPAAIPAEITAP